MRLFASVSVAIVATTVSMTSALNARPAVTPRSAAVKMQFKTPQHQNGQIGRGFDPAAARYPPGGYPQQQQGGYPQQGGYGGQQQGGYPPQQGQYGQQQGGYPPQQGQYGQQQGQYGQQQGQYGQQQGQYGQQQGGYGQQGQYRQPQQTPGRGQDQGMSWEMSAIQDLANDQDWEGLRVFATQAGISHEARQRANEYLARGQGGYPQQGQQGGFPQQGGYPQQGQQGQQGGFQGAVQPTYGQQGGYGGQQQGGYGGQQGGFQRGGGRY